MGIFGKTDAKPAESAPRASAPAPSAAPPAPQARAPPARQHRVALRDRRQDHVKGEITGAENLVVEGLVEGTIRITGDLRVGSRRRGQGHRERPVGGGRGRAGRRLPGHPARRDPGHRPADRQHPGSRASSSSRAPPSGATATCRPGAKATRRREAIMSGTFGNYIDGEWTTAASGRTFENRNPADTTELVGTLRGLRAGGRRGGGRRRARGLPDVEGPARPQARRDPLPRGRDPASAARRSSRAT